MVPDALIAVVAESDQLDGIKSVHAQAAEEFDLANNDGKRPEDVVATNKSRRYRFRCLKNPDHGFYARLPYARCVLNKGCPQCIKEESRKRIAPEKCVVRTHPKLLEIWHPTKNKLSPYEVTAGSNEKIVFVCEAGHEKEVRICDKTRCLDKAGYTGCRDCMTKGTEKLPAKEKRPSWRVEPSISSSELIDTEQAMISTRTKPEDSSNETIDTTQLPLELKAESNFQQAEGSIFDGQLLCTEQLQVYRSSMETGLSGIVQSTTCVAKRKWTSSDSDETSMVRTTDVKQPGTANFRVNRSLAGSGVSARISASGTADDSNRHILNSFRVLKLFLSAIFFPFVFQTAAMAVNPPTITPSTGVYSTIQSSATISGDAGATFYYTTNGTTPTTSSTQYTGPFAIGSTATIKAIAYINPNSSTVTTSNIQSDPNTVGVPKNALQLWLKSDFGPVLSGTNVTRWSDLSGASTANDATQSTPANQPTLVNGAINGYKAVNFNASNSQYLVLTSGLSNLTSGASIFCVMKPVGSSTATLFTTGNAGPTDLLSLQTIGTQAQLNVYNGTTSSAVTSPTGSLNGNFQLLSAVHNGSASASLSVNTVNVASGTVQNLNSVTRNQNFVGADGTTTTFLNGQLAEVLSYSRGVTASEQANIEAYLYSRYQLGTAVATPAPIISVPTGTLTGPTQVAISAGPQSTVYITQDGTTPTTSSPIYSAPINIAFSQTLKAMAVANGIQSSVVTAAYSLDSTQFPSPSATDSRPLQLNLQLPTTAIPQ